MTRILNFKATSNVMATEPLTVESVIDTKRRALNDIIAKIGDMTTFGKIAELIGVSHEYVRVRLVRQHKTKNNLMRWSGGYKVPRTVAVEFVLSTFGQP